MDLLLSEIVESEIAMRFLDRDRIEYTQLRDSIANSKWIKPILVRLRHDGKYEIIDGLHRYSIAKELEWTTIPVQITEATDDEAMRLGIVANAVSVTPKPAEYAYQLRRLCARNPDWTVGYIAGLVCQTPAWIRAQLDLLKLTEKVQRDVDAGRIPVKSAYVLSRCPKTWHEELREDAALLSVEQFQAKVTPILRDYNQRIKNGKPLQEPTFEPVASVRSMKVLKAALDKPSVADTLVLEGQCQTLADAFRLGVAWALQLDPAAAQQQRLNAQRKRDKFDRAERRRRKERALKAGRTDIQIPSSLKPVQRGMK
jgi:ParB/RepB/Spo0J family partition protein